MRKCGLSVPAGYIGYEDMSVFGSRAELTINNELAAAATRTLLAHPQGRPTAILCWRDETAMVAIRTCRQMGLTVPRDISVVGFSDIRTAQFFDPPLSTVKSPWDAMGRLAMRQVCERSFEEMALHLTSHFVPSSFIARQTTGPVSTT